MLMNIKKLKQRNYLKINSKTHAKKNANPFIRDMLEAPLQVIDEEIKRKEILDKVWTILSNKHEFYLIDMDKDEETQGQLLDLTEDIHKYYGKTSGLKQALKSNAYDHKRDYLRILKFILKRNGYTLYAKRCYRSSLEGEKKWTQKYTICSGDIKCAFNIPTSEKRT